MQTAYVLASTYTAQARCAVVLARMYVWNKAAAFAAAQLELGKQVGRDELAFRISRHTAGRNGRVVIPENPVPFVSRLAEKSRLAATRVQWVSIVSQVPHTAHVCA
jgi:hypothetical protein